MKKFIAIILISLALNILGLKNKTLYPYISDFFCTYEKINECTSVTTAKGFPLGYIPHQPDSSFDDLNFEFNLKNFALNLIFYYVLVNGIWLMYLRFKKK